MLILYQSYIRRILLIERLGDTYGGLKIWFRVVVRLNALFGATVQLFFLRSNLSEILGTISYSCLLVHRIEITSLVELELRNGLVTEGCQHFVNIEISFVWIIISRWHIIIMRDCVDMSTCLQKIDIEINFLVWVLLDAEFAEFLSISNERVRKAKHSEHDSLPVFSIVFIFRFLDNPLFFSIEPLFLTGLPSRFFYQTLSDGHLYETWFAGVVNSASLNSIEHLLVLPIGVGRCNVGYIMLLINLWSTIDLLNIFSIVLGLFFIFDHGYKADSRSPNIQGKDVIFANIALLLLCCHYLPPL